MRDDPLKCNVRTRFMEKQGENEASCGKCPHFSRKQGKIDDICVCQKKIIILPYKLLALAFDEC
jgi:hypothetical protein